MATFSEALTALPDFRNELLRTQQLEGTSAALMAFAARGAFSAMATPLSNIHATGVGIRQREGRYDPKEQVFKVYVFDKVVAEEMNTELPTNYKGVPVDVEQLPVQIIRPSGQEARPAVTESDDVAATETQASSVAKHRKKHRPIVGGVSISPLNANYVGTLGCFLRRRRVETEEFFALSNNHVLSDVDIYPIGTPIVQPGPEVPPFHTSASNTFAVLSMVIPINFPTNVNSAVVNRFDAAIASISDMRLIKLGEMLGIPNYDPTRVVTPVPGMRVIKSGRTTGVTRGRVTAVAVDGVQVNYGTQAAPRIAVFDDTIEIVGEGAGPFSLPGDSGSVILEEATGHPVALLFAGDGFNTTACDLGRLCRRLRAWPA